jgi:hypothetical protein
MRRSGRSPPAYPGFGDADGTGAAAEFAWPGDVAVDGMGNVYVADTYNESIRHPQDYSGRRVVTNLP